MTAPEILTNYWPFIVSLVALIVWLVRLEMRAHYNSKEIDEIKTEVSAIADIKQDLAVIKSDIKWLRDNQEKQ